MDRSVDQTVVRPDWRDPIDWRRMVTAGAPRRKAAQTTSKRRPASGDAGKRTRSNNRREDIVKAAAETFYRKGYDATTTQDIAEEVGMLKGSLYYYITAKEDLLFEIIDGVHTALAKNLDVVSAMNSDPLARLYTMVRLNVVVNAENLLNSAVFFRDFGSLTGRRRNRILALRDQGDQMVRELIQEGKVDGTIRPDVDPKVAATAINTMCNALYHWYRPEGELTPDALATAYADFAVAGLVTSLDHLEAARRRSAETDLSETGDGSGSAALSEAVPVVGAEDGVLE